MEHTSPAKYEAFDTVLFTDSKDTWRFEITPYGLKHLDGDIAMFQKLTNMSTPFHIHEIDKMFIALNPEVALNKEVNDKILALYATRARYEEIMAVI